MLEAARLDEVAEQAVRTLEFSVLAKYAFGLAQMFNAFYHRYPILNEERDDARRWRAAAVSYFRTPADGRAGPDGHRRSAADVAGAGAGGRPVYRGLKLEDPLCRPIIGIAPCRSLPDYVESVRRAGGEPRVLDPLKDQPSAGRSARWTGCS